MRDAFSAMAYIRRLALQELGRDDDAACFHLATLLWLGECQDGFHRAPPARPVSLDLDDRKPVS